MGKLSAIALALFALPVYAATPGTCAPQPAAVLDSFAASTAGLDATFTLRVHLAGNIDCFDGEGVRQTGNTVVEIIRATLFSGDGQSMLFVDEAGSRSGEYTTTFSYAAAGSYVAQESVLIRYAYDLISPEGQVYGGPNWRFAPELTSSLLVNVVGHAPEPETYAMMLAGLGLMGFIRRMR